MQFLITPMDAPAAAAIATWRYDEPFQFYNSSPDVAPYLLEPLNAYYAVRDETGALVGFFCYGAEAQVPGGHWAGHYADPTVLDIGLGMRPDLTSRGLGLAFVQAGLAFGRTRYAPAHFRLTVATFNERAIRVYERAGFVRGPVFPSPTPYGEHPFMLMEEAAPPD